MVYQPEQIRKGTRIDRLKFAWVAYKNAHRAMYGIPIAIEYELPPGMMPSQMLQVFSLIKITALYGDGKETKRGL